MRAIVPSLALILALTGCRTPAYLGGEYSHLESPVAGMGPPEELIHHDRWIFFWGLLGTEEISVPDVGGGFNLHHELASKFSSSERLVDLVVEEGQTIPGIIAAFFTLGIVSQKEIVVKARRAPATSSTTPPSPSYEAPPRR